MHLPRPAGPPVDVLPHSGEPLMIDKATGKRYPAAPAGSLLLSSAPLRWRGIVVERHRLAPAEMPEHTVIGHGISVNVGARPTSFAWTKGRNGWNDQPTEPGHCRVLTHGESHPTRWLQTYNEVSLVVDPQFVAAVVEDGLPPCRIEFVSRRSIVDSVLVDYASRFCAELACGGPNGVLYAEALTIGLVLHLLANHGVAKPKAPSPRGKLSSFQLRSVLECISSQPADDVSVVTLAERAHISPFPFCASLSRHHWCAAASIRVAAAPPKSHRAHEGRKVDAGADRPGMRLPRSATLHAGVLQRVSDHSSHVSPSLLAPADCASFYNTGFATETNVTPCSRSSLIVS